MDFNKFPSNSALRYPFGRISARRLVIYSLCKRILDIVFSVMILVLGFPLFVLVAALIKVTSEGPVFYCSMRIGKEGKLFNCWKFRSMFCDAEHRLTQILAENPHYKKEWQEYFKLKKDPRLTPIGTLLRKSSLDEFPQFWNVLIGDLSLVGPRPFLPNEIHEIQRIIEDQTDLLFSVKPGLTGIWQTSGRSQLTFQQRVMLDLNYIHQRSFLFDLSIIAKTVPMLLYSKGAF